VLIEFHLIILPRWETITRLPYSCITEMPAPDRYRA